CTCRPEQLSAAAISSSNAPFGSNSSRSRSTRLWLGSRSPGIKLVVIRSSSLIVASCRELSCGCDCAYQQARPDKLGVLQNRFRSYGQDDAPDDCPAIVGRRDSLWWETSDPIAQVIESTLRQHGSPSAHLIAPPKNLLRFPVNTQAAQFFRDKATRNL